MTLASVQVAGLVQRTDRVAVARLAAFTSGDVVVAFFALVAVATLHMSLATTFSGY